MDRRDFLRSTAAMGAGIVFAPMALGQTKANKKRLAAENRLPNIILIMADDIGVNDLSCYGNTEIKTPNLDSLAKGGVLFKTCWATPICSPSRAEIMTGKYGFRTQWFHNSMRPFPGEKGNHLGESHILFSQLLKRYGYATALAGKWQLDGQYPTKIFDYGFDEYCIHHEWIHDLPAGIKFDGFVSGKEYLWPGRTSPYWDPCIFTNGRLMQTNKADFGPDIINDYAIDFIERNKDKPFLLYYPMLFAHIAADFEGTEKECHVPVPEIDNNGKKTPVGFKYHVEYMDYLIGKIIKALDEYKLRDNTVIIFTSDNANEGKATPTEQGCHVPLICNCPKLIKSNIISSELVDFSDIYATISELAGASLAEYYTIDGKSFAPILKGDRDFHARDWIFSYYADKRMLRDKRWYLDGNGSFFDCGGDSSGRFYRDVTDSTEPEVIAAKQKFSGILKTLPTPEPNSPLIKRYQIEWEQKFFKKTQDHQMQSTK